jgi:hypothetical protein
MRTRTSLLIPALLAACGSAPDQSGSGPVITEYTARGKEGDRLTGPMGGPGSSWPDSAPDFAAAYPGAYVQQQIAANEAGRLGATISFDTKDAPEAVIKAFRDRAAKAGLGTVAVQNRDGVWQIDASDDPSGRMLSVVAKPADGRTIVTLQYRGADI